MLLKLDDLVNNFYSEVLDSEEIKHAIEYCTENGYEYADFGINGTFIYGTNDNKSYEFNQ